MHHLYHRAVSIGALAAALATASPAFADLTAHWRDDNNAHLSIVQSGTSVTLTRGTRVFEGTIDGNTVVLNAVTAPQTDDYQLVLSPDESVLEGVSHMFGCLLSLCSTVESNVVLTRCECFDGNMENGDGCDFQCRVEPCHSCSPEPSTCTALPDATPCEHPSQCIAGGACSAGSCEGGIVADSCTDMSGRWLRAEYEFDVSNVHVFQSQIAQHGNDLSVYSLPSAYLETRGTFEPVSRALTIGGAGGWPFCGTSSREGTVAADAGSFRSTFWTFLSSIRGCVGDEVRGELALRCAPGALGPVDGCRVASCQQCSGDPPVCVAVPDSTPCVPEDLCSVVATCEEGECVPTMSACNHRYACSPEPLPGCRQPYDPKTTSLRLRNADDPSGSLLRWSWRKGGAIRAYHLGQPDERSEIALCLYDESTSPPSLVFDGGVNDDIDPYTLAPQPGLEAGWQVESDRSARYRNRNGANDGITSIKLEAGQAGEGRLDFKARGENLVASGLPNTPLPSPLRAQLQIEGGACFEGFFGADGVSKNSGGTYKAKGTR